MARTISYSFARSLVKYCACHSNIKFISSRHRRATSFQGPFPWLGSGAGKEEKRTPGGGEATRKIKSFFPYKDGFNRSQKSKIVYKASCWDFDAFYIGKTKRRLHDRKTEHFKALTQIGHASAVAEHSISTGHNIKWDHFEILASGQCDLQCKIKETLLIRDLRPALNENVGSENLLLY